MLQKSDGRINGKHFSIVLYRLWVVRHVTICNATDLMTLSPMKVLKVNQMQLE